MKPPQRLYAVGVLVVVGRQLVVVFVAVIASLVVIIIVHV